MPDRSQPVRLAGRTLKDSRHVCAFFHSAEERNRVLMPFCKDGLERGEKVFHIIDGREYERHLDACRTAHIDVDSARENGQLEVLRWEDAYLRDGYFDGDRMVQILKDTIRSSRGSFPMTRFMGIMEWALEALPGVTDLVEYESKLNYVTPDFPDPLICVYDLNRHSGSVVMDILRTHPMVIIGGVLQENPLYVPPGEFLRELRSRKDGAGASAN